jgi:hypothetical protein
MCKLVVSSFSYYSCIPVKSVSLSPPALMRFMIMFKTDKDAEGVPVCKDVAEMQEFLTDLTELGVVISTEGLQPSARGARVTRVAGRVNAVDGPFTETKELIAGYVLVRVRSKAEAIELAGRFLEVAGEGTAEVREVIDSPHSEEAAYRIAAIGLPATAS